jgi:hypothetical protein
LAAAIAALGPYDLVVDYLWGAPAEAVFAALTRPGGRADASAAYASLLQQVAAGEVTLDIDPVPLAEVEKACRRPGATGASSSCPDGGRRPGATAAPGRRWFPLAANARLQPTGGRDGRWRRRHDGTAVG